MDENLNFKIFKQCEQVLKEVAILSHLANQSDRWIKNQGLGSEPVLNQVDKIRELLYAIKLAVSERS